MAQYRINKLLLLLCLMSFLTAGCASKWGLQTESSTTPLAWSDSAGTARIKHLMTIRGFKEIGTSLPHVLKYIIFGKSMGGTIIRPAAVATGRDNRLAIADTGCRCVHLYIPSEQKYIRIFSTKTDDLRSPVGAAFDDEMKLYVSDSVLGAICVFDKNGDYLFSIKKAGNAPLLRPTGLTYFPDENILYVSDTLAHAIYAFNTNGAFLFSIGGRGEDKSRFNFPTHIVASSAQKRLYVTDAMNFRIQVFDFKGEFLSSFGRHGDGSGDFAMPKGLAVDKNGIIYVVDSLFDTIQLFNITGDFLLTIGGRGGEHGEFWLPSGLFLDANEKLYVCDTYNQRIQIFQIIRNGQ